MSPRPSAELSGLLYALADEIRAEEGCVTESADNVEAAALRIDEQTLEIRCLKIEHDTLADHFKTLEAEVAELVSLLARYRNETPLGHQPHMISHLVDEALVKVRKP